MVAVLWETTAAVTGCGGGNRCGRTGIVEEAVEDNDGALVQGAHDAVQMCLHGDLRWGVRVLYDRVEQYHVVA